MFAFFGLGIMEIIVLGVLAIGALLVPLLVVATIWAASRKSSEGNASDEVTELRAEVKRLRAEIERLKEDANRHQPSDAIKSDQNPSGA
jgi:uncharacterized small protein (DUF1192 family)